MAGLLDFLGGAAGAYAGIKNEDRQRAQMEAYSARLREQEMKDWERKERIRQQLQREGRAGEFIGSPQIAPTGEMVALRYDETGANPNLAVVGEIPGQREAMEQERLRQQQRDELDRDVKQSQIVRNLRPRTGQGSGGPSVRDQIAVESHNMRLQDRAFELALEDQGISKTKDGYVRYEPGPRTQFGQGEPVPVPVPASEIARIRRQASGQGASEPSGERPGLLSQILGAAGSMVRRSGGEQSSSSAGTSEATAIPVTSEAEAYKYPGKWVRLGDMVTRVPD